MSMMTTTFNNYTKLHAMVISFDTIAADQEINKLVTTQFKCKPEFASFVIALERKFS